MPWSYLLLLAYFRPDELASLVGFMGRCRLYVAGDHHGRGPNDRRGRPVCPIFPCSTRIPFLLPQAELQACLAGLRRDHFGRQYDRTPRKPFPGGLGCNRHSAADNDRVFLAPAQNKSSANTTCLVTLTRCCALIPSQKLTASLRTCAHCPSTQKSQLKGLRAQIGLLFTESLFTTIGGTT